MDSHNFSMDSHHTSSCTAFRGQPPLFHGQPSQALSAQPFVEPPQVFVDSHRKPYKKALSLKLAIPLKADVLQAIETNYQPNYSSFSWGNGRLTDKVAYIFATVG